MHYIEQAFNDAQKGRMYNINHLAQLIEIERRSVIKSLAAHPFWFIDVPRTSSTSIQIMMGDKYGAPFGKNHDGEKYVTGISSFLIPSHTPAFVMQDLVGADLWDSLESFSIVRDPYRWCVSLWFYTQKASSLEMRCVDTFADFLDSFAEKLAPPLHARAVFPSSYRQSDYVTDLDGNVIVKKILKFEDREAINAHLESLGFEPQRSKKLNVLNSETYQPSRDEKAKIHQLFEKDFELFGYRDGAEETEMEAG